MVQTKKFCRLKELGVIDYSKALVIQEELVAARLKDEIPDTLLLLEHPPVFTLGTQGGARNLKVPAETLTREGISVVQTDRGGNITYHGYGQLVGYPIFDLRETRDLHQYVRNIEEVIIRTLKEFDIEARRDPLYPGVWIEQKKVASLGIRVKEWVTKHGFSINVNNKLKYFSFINPCGMIDKEVTTMAEVIRYQITIRDVVPYLLNHFSQVFHVDFQ